MTGAEISSSPAVSDGVVYVGSRGGKVYAFNVWTGTLKWSYQTAGLVYSPSAVSGGAAYVGSFDKRLYVFNQSLRSS